MKDHSDILIKTMGALYPFIIIFGIYVIVNGHITPGGGFQGGTILAACFIIHYLVTTEKSVSLTFLNLLEKMIYLAIIALPIVIVLYGSAGLSHHLKVIYLMIMNLLIGVKVCSGLTVIFFRFIFFESR